MKLVKNKLKMNLELYFQNVNTVITCIRVISTVDYMVAVGNDRSLRIKK